VLKDRDPKTLTKDEKFWYDRYKAKEARINQLDQAIDQMYSNRQLPGGGGGAPLGPPAPGGNKRLQWTPDGGWSDSGAATPPAPAPAAPSAGLNPLDWAAAGRRMAAGGLRQAGQNIMTAVRLADVVGTGAQLSGGLMGDVARNVWREEFGTPRLPQSLQQPSPMDLTNQTPDQLIGILKSRGINNATYNADSGNFSVTPPDSDPLTFDKAGVIDFIKGQ
jgi:hypothetical protein